MTRHAVIIPSYNRPEQLRACLGALMAQDAEDFEVIVVDDGSPVPLGPVCGAFGSRVRCIRQDNAGPARARNRGAAETDASFIAFTDDDCRPRPGWLSGLARAHGGDESRLVGGRVENGLPRDRYAAASQGLCDFLYDFYGADAGEMPFFTSNNMGLSRRGFERLGGFDETFSRAAAEDRDFGLRWRDEGGRLVYAPDAVIDHFHSMTWRKFLRQHVNYGAGAAHLHRLMDKRGSERPKFERFRFYGGLVSWPVRTGGLRDADLSVLMALSQAAMVYGYVVEGRRGGPAPTA